MLETQTPSRRVRWPSWHFSMPWGRVACIPDSTGHLPSSVDCIQWGRPEPGAAGKDPQLNAELFIARLEQAQVHGELDMVDHNLAELERLILEHEERRDAIERLLRRARDIRDMHEPSAERRHL